MKRIKLLVRNLYCNGCIDLIKRDIIRECEIYPNDITVEKKICEKQEIIIDGQNKINETDMMKILHRRGVELITFEETNLNRKSSYINGENKTISKIISIYFI